MRARSTLGNAAIIAIGAGLLFAPLFMSPVRLHASNSRSIAGLDAMLQERAARGTGRSPVIVRTNERDLPAVRALLSAAGGRLGRTLPGIAAQVAFVPDAALAALAGHPLVRGISFDRRVLGATERTSATIGATAVRQQLGYDGSGVGIAVIDSGITGWHDDLSDGQGGQRVARFVDFVNGAASAYDDYGHGTHVAGIIAGNGADSGGARTGIAPRSSLIVLKALDGSGRGRVSDVIAAIEYAIAEREALNIRVINLSVAAAVYESIETDPLALATERAVRSGIVVVAAAGNNGSSPEGRTRYRGVTAPGNSPWVLTVGGSSHMGTTDRKDDTMAIFSSRGPAAIDQFAKPDVVAPSVGIESLAAPESAFYVTWSPFLLNGTVATPHTPYLSLTGTSMAAPVVTGTVALMLQANAALTPNQVKAILQYTAEASVNYDPLTQGAGFLNAKGAVYLARYLASPSTTPWPEESNRWTRRLIWGNYSVKSGRITSDASAWPADVRWGQLTAAGAPVVWGHACTVLSCDGSSGPWTLAVAKPRNVVWGQLCGGTDCTTTWTLNAISGTSEGDTVVWGTTDNGETVVWGTIDGGETVVWGTEDSDTVVWGTTEGDTVVWGTGCLLCYPMVWQ